MKAQRSMNKWKEHESSMLTESSLDPQRAFNGSYAGVGNVSERAVLWKVVGEDRLAKGSNTESHRKSGETSTGIQAKRFLTLQASLLLQCWTVKSRCLRHRRCISQILRGNDLPRWTGDGGHSDLWSFLLLTSALNVEVFWQIFF